MEVSKLRPGMRILEDHSAGTVASMPYKMDGADCVKVIYDGDKYAIEIFESHPGALKIEVIPNDL